MQVNNIEIKNSNHLQKQQNIQRQNQNKNQGQNFGGAFDCVSLALRFLDTSPAWGATAVDVGSMVVPRTAVDFQRGPDAGLETLTRESSSSVNHALVGVYGALAGMLLASSLNGRFGIKFNKIFAGDKILDNLGRSWHDEVQAGNKDPLRKHLEKVVGSIEGFNPAKSKDGWVAISKENQKLIVDSLEEEIKNSKSSTISKDTEKYIRTLVTSSTGAEAQMRLKGASEHVTGLDLKTMLGNVYSVTKSFTSERVNKIFAETKDFAANDFIKSMKRFNKSRSLLGIGIAGAIGMSIQPINRYLTKKRTGQDKFVGGGEKDDSFGFKVRKALAAVAFGAGSFACISTNPKEIIPKLQFRGMVPSLNQFKAIYGLTIMSRFLSSRNDNELLESSVKDVIGFANWLILGNVVTKGVANALDKDLINIKDADKGKGFFNWLKNSSVKTRDEVLLASLDKAGISAVENKKSLSYVEMLKKIPASDAVTKVKLRNLNIAQVAGYLYSGLVLGVGLPKLNAYMTNTREAKKAKLKAQEEAAQNQNLEVKVASNQEYSDYYKAQIQMSNFLDA